MDGVGVEEGWKGASFGLALHSSYRILGLAPGLTSELPRVSLTLGDDAVRSRAPGRVLRDIRHPDDSPAMSIEQSPEGDFRIFAPQFGTHLVDAAGAIVYSIPAAGLEPWRWQRLLIGQVLPLVAAIRGYELLHASAIAVDRMAFALTGEPGAGKSTLAACLALHGCQLLADDVVALSLNAAGEPEAHPGSTSLSLRREQAHLGGELIRARLARAIGSDDKEHILFDAPVEPLPLGAIYHLTRATRDEPPIGKPHRASIADLMNCSYVRYVQTPARLTRQLEVQSAIGRATPIVPVSINSRLSPKRLAAQLKVHMAGIASGTAGW
jgi:Dephospho-CoA kinase